MSLFDDLAKAITDANEKFEELDKSSLPLEALRRGDYIKEIPCNDYPERIEANLKEISDQMTDYHTHQNREKYLDDLKAEKDKKQNFRHDFFVAAFTVSLTLLFEHIGDIVKFVLEFFRSLH